MSKTIVNLEKAEDKFNPVLCFASPQPFCLVFGPLISNPTMDKIISRPFACISDFIGL